MAVAGPLKSSVQQEFEDLCEKNIDNNKVILDFIERNFHSLDFTAKGKQSFSIGLLALINSLFSDFSKAHYYLNRLLIRDPTLDWNQRTKLYLNVNQPNGTATVPSTAFISLVIISVQLKSHDLDQLVGELIRTKGRALKFLVPNGELANAWYHLMTRAVEGNSEPLRIALDQFPLSEIDLSYLPKHGTTSILVKLFDQVKFARKIGPQLKSLPVFNAQVWNYQDAVGQSALFVLMGNIGKFPEGWDLLKRIVVQVPGLIWTNRVISGPCADQTPKSILMQHVKDGDPHAIALRDLIAQVAALEMSRELLLERPAFLPAFNNQASAAAPAAPVVPFPPPPRTVASSSAPPVSSLRPPSPI